MASTGETMRRRGDRAGSRGVRRVDAVARVVIAVGGMGTIGAVLLVCVFLAWVVAPMFLPSRIEPGASMASAGVWGDRRPVHVEMNEYSTAGLSVFTDGTVELFDLSSGEVVDARAVSEGAAPTSMAFVPGTSAAIFGYEDGSLRFATIRFETDESLDEDAVAQLSDLGLGEARPLRSGIAEHTGDDQYRLETLGLDVNEPLSLGTAPVVLVDRSERPSGPIVVAVTNDGVLHARGVRQRRNLLTGELHETLTGGSVPIDGWSEARRPVGAYVTGAGDSAMLLWSDGLLRRYDIRRIEEPVLAEEVDLAPEPGVEVSRVGFMNGKGTMLVGDSTGRVRAWFKINDEDADTPDGGRLVAAHDFEGAGSPVTAFGASARERVVAVGYANGDVGLYHVTSQRRLGTGSFGSPGGVDAITIAPRGNELMAVTDERIGRWDIDAPHPEVTLRAIFMPVWYEGYPGPANVWQSSSGTDDTEPKFGLIPLIFGTIKATVYCMLISVPLALFAAVYTSEFMHPRSRARVKPVVEVMASLPSVVLGFLAALVFAPFIENIVPEVIAAFATVPFVVLLGAHLWQLMPRHVSLRYERLRIVLIAAALPVSLWLAALVGPLMERWLFAGDIKAWLDGQVGTGTGGWMLVLLPACAVGVAFFVARVVTPTLRARQHGGSHGSLARLDLLKFLAGSAAAVVLALGLSWTLSTVGLDPRGTFVDTYIQRNALIVGFAMGFAVVPIIYTISEDALSSVPEHLRAASLGAGATHWQTAVRVIIPTAMSGIFSAIMIGLGRAVGETMIVLMAAGNTPVLNWNIFSGFRTLSANIAVELPEAVKGSTHYRMLFLAALVLFVLTFCLNTAAEVVRIRFRKRAVQL